MTSSARALEREVRLAETLLFAVGLALPLGVVDAALGVARAPRGSEVALGAGAALLFHPALAVVVVALSWPVLRAFGGRARATLREWLSAPPGGVEATRAVVAGSRAGLVGLALLGAALVGSEALADIQTALYVAAGQTLLGAAALAASWQAGSALARALDGVALPIPGLSRARAFVVVVVAAAALFAAIAIERDVVFKEIDPWLVTGLLWHVIVALVAVVASGAVRAPARLPLAALALVVVALVAGSARSAGTVVGIYAPVAAPVARAAGPLSDFDRDGVAWLLGGADCGPFDEDVHGGAREKPGDGVDQDCDGVDLELVHEDVPQPEPLPEEERSELLVVISVDSLRRDHIGAYGGGELTPNLDRFAERAVVFDNAYTSGTVTLAALPGLLTGRAMTEVYRHMDERQLDKVLPTLPEVLKPAGFRSGMVVDGIAAVKHGWDRGFDTRIDLRGGKRERADEVVDRALAWLDDHDEGKRLLWVHVFDPHGPYRDVPGIDHGKGRAGRYAEGVAFMDRHVGRLLDHLVEEDATIVFVADHGEHLGEGGRVGHGKDVYAATARIPLFVSTPWTKPRRVKTAVWQLDVLPTLAHIAGVEAPLTRGRSLVPELKGAPDDLERAVFTEAFYGYEWLSVSTATHRLLYAAHANSYELYDVAASTVEAENRHAFGDAVSDALRRRLSAYSFKVRDPAGEQDEEREELFTVDEVPDDARLSAPARLPQGVEVLGYRMTKKGRRKQEVVVYLRPEQKLERSYRVEVALEHAQKRVAASVFPGNGRFPTHRWEPGMIVSIAVPVKITEEAALASTLGVAFVDAHDESQRFEAEPSPLPPRAEE